MAQTVSLDAYSILKPFMELIEDPDTRENVEETARIYFTGTGVTVNLIPSLIIGLLLLIGLLKLLGLPILASFGLPGGGDAGYGAPSGGYGAPSGGYGAPSSGYDSPSSGYDSPSSGYDSPGTGSGFNPGSDYSAPDSGYSAGRRKRAVEAQDYLTKEELEMFDDMGLIFAYPSQSLNNGPLLSHLLPQLEAADSLNHLLE